jgi:hypothetical protein
MDLLAVVAAGTLVRATACVTDEQCVDTDGEYVCPDDRAP